MYNIYCIYIAFHKPTRAMSNTKGWKKDHKSSMSKKSSMVCSPPWLSVHQGEWRRLPLRPASKLADKRNQPYSLSIQVRCQLSFSLIRSSIMCLGGNRFPSTPDSLLLTITDARIVLLIACLICSTWPPYIIILCIYLWFASFVQWRHCKQCIYVLMYHMAVN